MQIQRRRERERLPDHRWREHSEDKEGYDELNPFIEHQVRTTCQPSARKRGMTEFRISGVTLITPWKW